MSSTPKIISHISARQDVSNYLLDIRKFWWSRRNQDTDLVLVSGKKSVEIHQAVILPLSSFLKGIVPSSCPCILPAIILPPVPPDALDALVELLYLGRSTAGSGDVEGKVAELLALLWINVDIYRDHGREDTNAGENQNEESVNDFEVEVDPPGETEATVKDCTKESVGTATGIVPKTHLPTGPDARRTGRKRNAMEPDDNHDKKVRKSAADRDFNSSVKNLEISSKDQPNQKRKYCCDQCDSKFTRKIALKTHIESIHHDNVKFRCNQCSYQATKKSNLVKHIDSIHDNVKYLCNQCGYQATEKSSLIRHIKSIHDKVKYQCNKCDYQATSKSNLIRHIDSIHAKVKYPCNQCDYRASTKSSLKRHVKAVHGKVSPSSRATSKSNRSNHHETISGNASHSNDHFDLRSSRNTRQSRQTETSKRVPDSEAVKKCSVRIMKLDRYQLGVRNCEVRILRISPNERIAGREIGQSTDLDNGTNSEIEKITIDDEEEIEEVPRNDGNGQSTALVSVGTGANEVIEEIHRDEDIEEVPRNDDNVIRVTSFSITITRKTRK